MGYEIYFPRERTDLDYIRMLIGRECDVDAAISPNGPIRNPEKWCPEIPYKNGEFDTPSGKLEFYSSVMEERGKKCPGEFCPLSEFFEPMESVLATPELAKKYPLNVISQHPAFRTHSQYYNLPWIQEIEGPAKLFMSWEDAAERGIQDGDLVRVFNDRGELKNIVAKVGIRVKPGIIELSSGMWVKLGGSVNKLTGLYPGGPRDILRDGGIMREYHPLMDGNTGSYFNTLADVRKM